MRPALPNAPSLTLPFMLSPSTVATNSRVIGIGLVMAIDQESVSPSTVPLMALLPIGLLASPVKVFPLVVMAKEAWGDTELKGANAADVHLENPKMQRADPLGQQGFAGWKMYYCCTRLNESWMVRIEGAATNFAE